jgi:acyl-CoA thioester hydrolase
MAGAPLTANVALKVPFHHCDPLFVVWHGHYLKYFEYARCALLAQYALDVQDVRALGYRMFISDARCRYTFPLGYGDEIDVRAQLTATLPFVRVGYRVTNVTRSRASARGHTVLVTTDADGKLLATTPAPILERLPRLASEAER